MPLLGGTTGLFRAAGGLLAGCVEGCCASTVLRYVKAIPCEQSEYCLGNLYVPTTIFATSANWVFRFSGCCYQARSTYPSVSTRPAGAITFVPGENLLSCSTCCVWTESEITSIDAEVSVSGSGFMINTGSTCGEDGRSCDTQASPLSFSKSVRLDRVVGGSFDFVGFERIAPGNNLNPECGEPPGDEFCVFWIVLVRVILDGAFLVSASVQVHMISHCPIGFNPRERTCLSVGLLDFNSNQCSSHTYLFNGSTVPPQLFSTSLILVLNR